MGLRWGKLLGRSGFLAQSGVSSIPHCPSVIRFLIFIVPDSPDFAVNLKRSMLHTRRLG